MHQYSEGEAPALPAQRRPAEPRGDAGEVQHEGGRVQADFRKPVRTHVQSHALEGGRHDDSEQQEQDGRELPERALVLRRLVAEQPVGAGEQGEHEGAGRHELEEAAAGVLRVGEAARGDDERGAAEQVSQLNDDEDQKQQVDEPQRGRHGNDAEREPALPFGSRHERTDQCAPEVSRHQRPPHGEQDYVRQQVAEVDVEGTGNHGPEHAVGRGKQTSEHHEQGERQRRAQRRSPDLPHPSFTGELPPRYVVTDERDDAQPRVQGAGDAGMDVVPRLAPAQRDALEAQAGDRQEDHEADGVEQMEDRRVARDEVRGDEQRGAGEPQRVARHRHVVATDEPPRCGDQGDRAHEGIQAPWHGAQQRVAEDSRQSRRAQDVQPEARSLAHGAHPAAASGRAPKRRWRVRKSPAARVSSAGPKSGHMVSVKYNSA